MVLSITVVLKAAGPEAIGSFPYGFVRSVELAEGYVAGVSGTTGIMSCMASATAPLLDSLYAGDRFEAGP